MPRRRSIFSFSLRSPKTSTEPPSTPTPSEPPTPSDIVSLPDDPEARYIPRQWQPNRLATFYVTPSEQNLYLAMMASLDAPAPQLPLWAESPPQLPPHNRHTVLDDTPPVVPSPPRPAHMRLPLSPKLVTSPTLPPEGLSVREEFRRLPNDGQQPSRHALMAFSDEAQIRFHNFPRSLLIAVDTALGEAWPKGVSSRHPPLDSMPQRQQGGSEGDTWVVVLRGRVWKQAGNAELESIRLVLALLSTLGSHGWQLVEKVQATGNKYDHHNLLFAFSPSMAAQPPAFFALSVPLPDRISIVSPPNSVTPALVSSVRQAILSQSHSSKRSGVAGADAEAKKHMAEWDAWKGGIRLEGWVHPGVYRFWMDGLRRWLSGAVKWGIVERLHPPLILSIINALGAQHFNLLTSLPLLPLQKGRDILIFQSSPASGLTVNDNWQDIIAPIINGGGEESPVLVSQEDAQPGRHEALPAELHDTRSPRQMGNAGTNTSLNSSSVPEGKHKRHASVDSSAQNWNPIRRLSIQQNNRLGSIDSDRPLLPATATGPRRRNLLLKKTSLRREGSQNSKGSKHDSMRPRQVSDAERNRHIHIDETGNGPLRLRDGPGEPRVSTSTDVMYRSERPEGVHLRSRHGIGSDISEDEDSLIRNGGEWSMVDLPGSNPKANVNNTSSLGLDLGSSNANEPPAGATTTGNRPEDGDLPIPPPIPARRRPDSPHRDGTPGYFYKTSIPPPQLTQTGAAPGMPPRPSFDSDASVYHDAEIDTPIPPPGQQRDNTASPGPYGYMNHGGALHIANPTPPLSGINSMALPPVSGSGPSKPFNQTHQSRESSDLGVGPRSTFSSTTDVPLGAKLDVPISSTRPGLRGRGRDALVDVGSGVGIESIVGSVGYLGGRSQSMLALTPAQSHLQLPSTASDVGHAGNGSGSGSGAGAGVGTGYDRAGLPMPRQQGQGARAGSSRTKVELSG